MFLLRIQDNGEGRRLGTLVVWLDSGIESDIPLLALPINLSVLLDLPQDKVWPMTYLNTASVGERVRVRVTIGPWGPREWTISPRHFSCRSLMLTIAFRVC